jgi:putative ABC transport system ATP-binding protein
MHGVNRRDDITVVDPLGEASVATMTALLRIRDVSKVYPDGSGELVVLDKASMEMTAGTHVGLYGKRRSGKSTFLRIAAGIERPDAGSVLFDGEDLTCISGSERARLLRSRGSRG